MTKVERRRTLARLWGKFFPFAFGLGKKEEEEEKRRRRRRGGGEEGRRNQQGMQAIPKPSTSSSLHSPPQPEG
jgi:hypothetical protein